MHVNGFISLNITSWKYITHKIAVWLLLVLEKAKLKMFRLLLVLIYILQYNINKKCWHGIDMGFLQEQLNPSPAYNPQVEAISPTLPADNVIEDANFRSTKDDLLQQISKVDREISNIESTIAMLKKKEVIILTQ